MQIENRATVKPSFKLHSFSDAGGCRSTNGGVGYLKPHKLVALAIRLCAISVPSALFQLSRSCCGFTGSSAASCRWMCAFFHSQVPSLTPQTALPIGASLFVFQRSERLCRIYCRSIQYSIPFYGLTVTFRHFSKPEILNV